MHTCKTKKTTGIQLNLRGSPSAAWPTSGTWPTATRAVAASAAPGASCGSAGSSAQGTWRPPRRRTGGGGRPGGGPEKGWLVVWVARIPVESQNP